VSRSRSYDLPFVPMGETIPRIIHQTSKSADLVPELQANVDHIKRQNPTFAYNLYTDRDIQTFIMDEYGESVLEKFLLISPRYGAARADLFRYLLMYKAGGVYLDIKSSTNAPLEMTLRPDDRYILSYWDNAPGGRYPGWGRGEGIDPVDYPRGEFQQWYIIAVRGHPFLAAVIDQVLRNIDEYSPWRDGVGTAATFKTMGPICYTKVISGLLDHHPHRRVETELDVGLSYSCYEDKMQHRSLSLSYYRSNKEPLVAPQGVPMRIMTALYMLRHTSNFARGIKAIVNKVAAVAGRR
jgi:hypothetical protein